MKLKKKHHMLFLAIVAALVIMLFLAYQRSNGGWTSLKTMVDPGASAKGTPETGQERKGGNNSNSPSFYDNGTGIGTSSQNSFGGMRAVPQGGAGGWY